MTVFAKVVLIATMIAVTLFFLMTLLAKRAAVLRNAATPYECGFDPIGSARTPFSLRFFLLAIIFIIFDVEVALLFPILFVLVGNNATLGAMSILFFLLILIMGLFHEWREGSLDWV